jgi:hypothetical protein
MPPGSPQAIARGCNCPVTINNYGKGAFNVPSEQAALAFIHLNCPVHGVKQMKQTCNLYDFDKRTVSKLKVS